MDNKTLGYLLVDSDVYNAVKKAYPTFQDVTPSGMIDALVSNEDDWSLVKRLLSSLLIPHADQQVRLGDTTISVLSTMPPFDNISEAYSYATLVKHFPEAKAIRYAKAVDLLTRYKESSVELGTTSRMYRPINTN